MAAKGKLLLLKISNGGEPETFSEIASARSNSMSINNEQVDITTKGSQGWREYLEGAGIQSMALSISGVLSSDTAEEALRTAATSNTIERFQLAFGDDSTATGAFAVSSFEVAGEHNGEQTFSASLESSGVITFE